MVEDELPREVDRAFLEVLAEREVAKHLEEGQVVCVEPDLVDVGRAEDLLDGGEQQRRRRLAAEEVRHQRLHARAVEQRRAIPVRRDERPGRMPFVALRLEEREEAFSQLGARAHGRDCTSRTFGALVFHTRVNFPITITPGRRWAVPLKKPVDFSRRLAASEQARPPRTRSPRGSARAPAGSTATRASARSRPAVRSATASVP